MRSYWAISVLASIIILGGLGISQQAFASLTLTTFSDDPQCDTLFGPPVSDEIGEGLLGASPPFGPPTGPFPSSEELDVVSQVLGVFGTCPSPNGGGIDSKIEITNLSGKAWEHVVYVSDSDNDMANYDGFVNGEEAMEIDTFGTNVVLTFESIIADDIWQPGETWEFILQDFAAANLFELGSVGIAATSAASLSTGSIIVWNEEAIGGTILPIDTTALLLAGAQTTTPWLILGIVSAVGIGLAVFTIKRNR